MRRDTKSFGTMPAFIKDDLPEPLAPTRAEREPAAALATSWTMAFRASSDQEDRRVLELVGFQSAKRRLLPYPGSLFVTGRGQGCNAPLDELAQVLFECRRKLGAARKLGVRAEIAALIGEVP
jgi:hypothetical protein